MICKKCSNTSSIFLKNKGSYCEECFIANVNHKFRARLGKYRLFSKDSHNVLVCLSSGTGSTVLLDLVCVGVSMTNSKKLKIIPQFVYITDTMSDAEINVAEEMIEKCKKYNMNIHVTFLSECMHESVKNIATNCMPLRDEQLENTFQNLFKIMSSPSVKNDFLKKAKRKLYLKLAKQFNCSYVFTAETTKMIAENLLTSIVMGQGCQIQNEVGFCDDRDDFVKFLRPMCDVTEEEVQHYMFIKKIDSFYHHSIQSNSLQSVMQTYLKDLQKNSEATISTMCKTADKIGTKNNNTHSKKCVLCQGYINEDRNNVTARQATLFSTIVSCESLKQDTLKNFDNYSCESANPEFCYSCNRNYLNGNTSSLANVLMT